MIHAATTIHEFFEVQAAATPGAVAVECWDRELTYGQLNERANRLAHRLIRRGVTRGTFVGMCLERSAEVIIALLGILKAGAAYVPLDPSYPDERLALMLDDTAVRVVLGHTSTAARLAAFVGRTHVIDLDRDDSLASEPATNPHREGTGTDVAYVMYTSGSTGRPKGVLVCHRGVVRLVRGGDYCDFGPDEVFLLHSPLTFDASTFEIWGALLNGGRLAILPPGLPAPDVLANAIRRHGVTTLLLVTGLFHLMVDQRPDDLALVRQLLAGGDVLSPAHVRRALDSRANGILVNAYGPTECATMVCCFRMTREYRTSGSIPIGRPLPKTTVHVLDERMQPVPAGVPGELYAGGDCVAAGYLNQPELTRERFLPDPFGPPGAYLYRTGDRVRLLPDGNLEYLGRFDAQVKIAGHRIEPEEVEVTLQQHPAICQAAVVARALPSGEKQLVAYVVAADEATFSVGRLRSDLGERLPAHLVPAQFVRLDQLPLNPNGKVNRAALVQKTPAPNPPTVTKTALPGPGREAELVALWTRVLGRAVGPDDNFFDSGGSSLQLLEIHAELTKTLGRPIPLLALFEHPTVRSVVRWLDSTGAANPALSATADRARMQKDALARRRRLS